MHTEQRVVQTPELVLGVPRWGGGVLRGLEGAEIICIATDGVGVAKLDTATTSFDVLASALWEKVVESSGVRHGDGYRRATGHP